VGLFGNRKESTAAAEEPGHDTGSFLPHRTRRRRAESVFARVVATGGVIGIATAIAAILGSQDVDTWITGLVVSTLSVILAGVLWSSRTL
jgi:hypothetical protein